MTTQGRCDACHTETVTTTCLGCRTEFCPSCEEIHVRLGRHPSLVLAPRPRDEAQPDRVAL